MTDTALLALLLALAATVVVLAGWRWLRRRGARRITSPAPRPGAASARLTPATDPAERIRREIEDRVLNLRRAREEAERWVPPPVDAVSPRRTAAAAPPDFADTSFADTTIPDDDDPPPSASGGNRPRPTPGKRF